MVLKRADSDAPTPSEELVRLARAGSSEAFGTLVGRYEGAVFRFLRIRTRSAAEAEELTHEVFVRAWEKLHRYRDRWQVSTWLFAIARRQVASHARRRRRLHARTGAVPDDVAGASPEPSEALSRREQRDDLWDVVARVLDAEQRSALWLRYAEGLEAREIGRILGKRPTTVRVLLLRARRRLASHLDAHRTARPAHRARLDADTRSPEDFPAVKGIA